MRMVKRMLKVSEGVVRDYLCKGLLNRDLSKEESHTNSSRKRVSGQRETSTCKDLSQHSTGYVKGIPCRSVWL
jgi:hypothetical protein